MLQSGEEVDVDVGMVVSQIGAFAASKATSDDVSSVLRAIEGIADSTAAEHIGSIATLIFPSAIVTADGSAMRTADATRGQLIDAAAVFRAQAKKQLEDARRTLRAAISLEQLCQQLPPGGQLGEGTQA